MKDLDIAFCKYIEEKALRDIFADGVLIADSEGVIVYYRNYRTASSGYFTNSEIIGKHILEVYPSIDPEESTLLKALRGIPSIEKETHQISYSGRTCYLKESTLPLRRKGKIIGAISFAKYANYFSTEVMVKGSEKNSSLFCLDDIIGASSSVKALKEKIELIAETNSSVLIIGDTGTGKEMVAQSIHTCGQRKNKVFLSQNCSAIPSSLLESILFGTVKGSFTGAEDRPGIFEIANGGSVFLDEINSMSLEMQAKILKVIEEKRITRIGSSKPVRVDVRIISAINELPKTCIESNRLRKDLFFRLATVILDLPPLRNRMEDLPLLTEHFIEYFNHEMGKSIKGISPAVSEFFHNYSWPGNIRELKNIIEGAFNMAVGDEITIDMLPSYLKTSGISKIYEKLDSHNIPLPVLVNNFEKNCILEEVSSVSSINELAVNLGISRQSLDYKIKKYGIDLPFKR